ncbi:MAG: hypothetical protein AB7O98_09450 [Hyphomonadaceae bacterium]
MAQTVLIVGRSPAARAVLPALLREQPFTLISTDDPLCAIHIMEKTRIDFIVVDANLRLIDGATFADIKTRDPRFTDIALQVARVSGDDAPLGLMIDRCTAAWAREAMACGDARVLMPAVLSCVERALTL